MDVDHHNHEIKCEDRPSTVQLEGEINTEDILEKPTPGQPNKGIYGEQSYTLVIESPERHDSDEEPQER